MDKLHIFTAGVAKKAISDCAERWNREHAELTAEITSCGSVDLARKILAGESCDIFVSADESILTDMLMPDYAKGYIIFAGNKIVIQDLSGRGINSENWKEKLLDPGCKFRHKNPFADPGGYRGVMALLLADKYEEGLSKKLCEHPGRLGMDPEMTAENAPPHDYLFTYYSMAKSSGEEFADLPEIMNLSNPELNNEYSKVSFAVDDKNIVKGSAIAHCITIPEGSFHKDSAKLFVKSFLKTDFMSYNFLKNRKSVGEEII